MKAYRAEKRNLNPDPVKLKVNPVNDKEKVKFPGRNPKTRAGILDLRTYWKQRQALSRANMSAQKKRRVREREKRRREAKKAKERAHKRGSSDEDGGWSDMPNIVEEMSKMRGGIQARRILMLASRKVWKNASKVSRSYGVSRKLAACSRVMRKKRADSLPLSKKVHVQSFYKSQQISRASPCKKHVTKHGPRFTMNISLKTAYCVFLKTSPFTLSFSYFAYLRPKNVKLLNRNRRDFCMCPHCENINLKLLSLETKNNIKAGMTVWSLYGHLMCKCTESSAFPEPECIFGDCKLCNDTEMMLKKVVHEDPSNELTYSWHRWEREGQKVSLNTKTGRFKDIFDELVHDIRHPTQNVTLKEHLFTASWQYKQVC